MLGNIEIEPGMTTYYSNFLSGQKTNLLYFFSNYQKIIPYKKHMIWPVNETKHNFFGILLTLYCCFSSFFVCFNFFYIFCCGLTNYNFIKCFFMFAEIFSSFHLSTLIFLFSRIFYLYVFLWNSFILLFLASKVTVFLIYRILCASWFF